MVLRLSIPRLRLGLRLSRGLSRNGNLSLSRVGNRGRRRVMRLGLQFRRRAIILRGIPSRGFGRVRFMGRVRFLAVRLIRVLTLER
jgi:hypothetical protein